MARKRPEPDPQRKRRGVPRPYAAANLGEHAQPLPDGYSTATVRVTAPDDVLDAFRAMSARERGALIAAALRPPA